jgi:hypothetical protein
MKIWQGEVNNERVVSKELGFVPQEQKEEQIAG